MTPRAAWPLRHATKRSDYEAPSAPHSCVAILTSQCPGPRPCAFRGRTRPGRSSGHVPSYLSLDIVDIHERARRAVKLLGEERCEVCPRLCTVGRLHDERGLCGIGRHAVVASFFAHSVRRTAFGAGTARGPDATGAESMSRPNDEYQEEAGRDRGKRDIQTEAHGWPCSSFVHLTPALWILSTEIETPSRVGRNYAGQHHPKGDDQGPKRRITYRACAAHGTANDRCNRQEHPLRGAPSKGRTTELPVLGTQPVEIQDPKR